MHKTLKEIAQLIEGTVVGDDTVAITGVCGIKEAKLGDITFVANPRYISLMDHTQASAIITTPDVKNAPKPLIITENPSLAFAKLLSLVAPNNAHGYKGIHPTAVIGENVKLGNNIAIYPYVVIEDNAEIADNTIIFAGVFVGYNSKIGADTIIYPHVSIRERVEIGNRVIIHSGTVIGSDGFGFATVKGLHHKIPQIGTVIIEDDVEIGANVTIDRARFDKTWIKHGTKIDNLVQIAHNVVIGENSIVVAQAGISGSTVVGKNVVLAGQAGIIGHITIGDNAVVAAQAGVTKSVPKGTCVSGYPAKPHKKAKRINACVQKLPGLYKLVNQLEGKIASLEAALKEKNRGATEDDCKIS
ncbi:MAG: UDP-3-O-(3-hydroxymyristoyl)glucosamine N-acyltransferase [Candidatus Omnitrophica bacterium]|nr:UDP-3-O-(3-hydroxymyristoyl)glucosamine N-acyltransferase [Candidatus Omnitrophota bacterium]MBU1924913.1 UDP-3-O-(3-hydroxymyristoyl)glucosamine N-acyltransferase [Candidatus Omnitrophota bacterium]